MTSTTVLSGGSRGSASVIIGTSALMTVAGANAVIVVSSVCTGKAIYFLNGGTNGHISCGADLDETFGGGYKATTSYYWVTLPTLGSTVDRHHPLHLMTLRPKVGVSLLDGVLLDRGVLPFQTGDAACGFSYRTEGSLDIRDGNHRAIAVGTSNRRFFPGGVGGAVSAGCSMDGSYRDGAMSFRLFGGRGADTIVAGAGLPSVLAVDGNYNGHTIVRVDDNDEMDTTNAGSSDIIAENQTSSASMPRAFVSDKTTWIGFHGGPGATDDDERFVLHIGGGDHLRPTRCGLEVRS